MKATLVDAELAALAAREAAMPAPVQPEDVERFRIALQEPVDPAPAPEADASPPEEGGQRRRLAAPDTPASYPARPAPSPTAVRAVARVRRSQLNTHTARSAAVEPLAKLLATIGQRPRDKDVHDLKIVPAEPNPLGLTLFVTMRDGEFVVKARTTLSPERREEAQLALNVLQSSLRARLRLPAHVVLLA